jgi:hypothetical protein
MEEQEDHHNDDVVEVPSSTPPRTSMMITTRRRRPTSSKMTPDAKRHRVLPDDHDRLSSIVAYPSEIPVPPKSTIAALYESALQASSDNAGDVAVAGAGTCTDQAYLKPAGILSLEQVLLPALGIQEEKALKRVQAKVQRDAPECYKLAMETCRRLVRQSVAMAIQAAEQSRMDRCQHQQELRQHKTEQRRLQREARARALQEQQEARAQERQRLKELENTERMRVLARQYPRNQELWKEVFFLTSSITQLEKEERMWIQAEQDLIQSSSSSSSSTTTENATTATAATTAATTTTTNMQDYPEPKVVQAPKDPLQEKAEQTLQDIVLASTRIQQGLGIVLNILEESDQVRKEMYRKYRQDHQFHGYQGVRNPKGLIRFLSQEE